MSSILRTALRAWYALRLLALRRARRPRGPATIRSGDPRADRVLLVGNGVTHGWGVDDHRLALSGRLADAVADRTARGCDVEVVGAESMNARSAASWLGDRDLSGFDAVVVALGVNDALRRTSVADWERGLGDLLAAIVPRVRPEVPVLVVGIPPLRALAAFDGVVARTAEGHRERLNALTPWVAELHGVGHLDVTGLSADTWGRWSPSMLYAQLGARIAVELAPSLVASRPEPEPREPLPEQEWEWSGADEVVRLAAEGGSAELQRLATTAQKAFRVELAVVSLVDGDRLYYANNTDVMPGSVPLDLSFCRHTVAEEGPVIVPDARVDDRFSDNPLVELSYINFYAGYPLRASDGRVIGSFCLQGSRARSGDSVSLDRLRDLALEAQAELQRFEKTPPLPADGTPRAEGAPTPRLGADADAVAHNPAPVVRGRGRARRTTAPRA